jgi:Arc/MetJ-type ribon-helix-helix transcriptional regulator
VSRGGVEKLSVSVPAEISEELERALAAGLGGGNRSRVVTEALRAHLRAWRRKQLAAAAAELDPAGEAALVEAFFAARRPVEPGRPE